MPLPENVATVDLTGRYVRLDGTPPLPGKVHFNTNVHLRNPGADVIIVPVAVSVDLDSAGAFTARLPTTNDPDLIPGDWTYTVKESLSGWGRTYRLKLPTTLVGPVHLADLVPEDGDPPPDTGGGVRLVHWDDVLGKPATFPPAAHEHPAYATPAWASLTGVPAVFPPAAHSHPELPVGRVGNVVDLRDHQAVLDGVADDGPALQAAVDEVEAAGRGAVILPAGGIIGIGTPVVMRRGSTLMGWGSRATLIRPLPGFTGWPLTIEGNGRNGQWTVTSSTYDPAIDQSGVTLRGFMVNALDRTEVKQGVRIVRDDDVFLDDIQFGYLRGTALQIGALDPPATGVGSVRESEFRRIKVYKCGDAGGVHALVVRNAATGSGDGTNQLLIDGMRFAYNHGGILETNPHLTETVRRTTWSHCQVHGLTHPTSGELADHDLFTIQGAVINTIMESWIVNGSGTGLAIIRCKAHPDDAAKYPQGLAIDNLQAAETVGDILAADKVSDFKLDGRFGIGTIDGAIVRLGVDAATVCFDVNGVGASNITNVTVRAQIAAKFVIPSTFRPRGTVRWAGKVLADSELAG